jgi:hypothetical protein
MAKETLYKKDAVSASQLMLVLIDEIVDNHDLEQKLIRMYSSIIRELPDFQISLSEDLVFSSFAPVQLKNTVIELFEQVK